MTDLIDPPDDTTVTTDPSHARSAGHIGRALLDRDTADIGRDDIAHCIKRHIDHGWWYCERPDGYNLFFGPESDDEIITMMVFEAQGYANDPIVGKMWLDAPKVAQYGGLDAPEPEPDRTCTIELDYQYKHAPLEVAREVWRRLHMLRVEEGAL
jgi:hypothetical protein